MGHPNRRTTDPSRRWQWEPEDLTHVCLDSPAEIQYWMAYFGASANRLHEAVSLMGSEVPRVRACLRRFR